MKTDTEILDYLQDHLASGYKLQLSLHPPYGFQLYDGCISCESTERISSGPGLRTCVTNAMEKPYKT